MIPRLVEAGFRLLPTFEILTHYVLERDGCVALVERHPDGAFGAAGAPGVLLDGAFAVLVWKDGRPWLVAKEHRTPASAEDVESIRRFDADLREALSG